MKKYQVVVGNLGTPIDTDVFTEALHAYSDYKKQSEDGVGRAAG